MPAIDPLADLNLGGEQGPVPLSAYLFRPTEANYLIQYDQYADEWLNLLSTQSFTLFELDLSSPSEPPAHSAWRLK